MRGAGRGGDAHDPEGTVTDLAAAIATGIALAGAVIAYRRWGWRGVVGGVVVVLAALAGP